MPESAIESHRVRKCVCTFFLEDGTIKISEPKIGNSGLSQGPFLKRSMVTNTATKLPFQAVDFMVGSNVNIFGHVFHVTRCDSATRKYFIEELQKEMPSNESYPDDNHSAVLRAQETEANPRRSRVNPKREDKLRNFLQYDGKVLRFYCEWDEKEIILHFYLADDTVELKEVRDYNNGHAPFPLLLSRQKIPASLDQNSAVKFSSSSQTAKNARNLSASDFVCGEYVQIYGRSILLQSCDKFTYDFYDLNLGMEQVLEEIVPVSRESIRELKQALSGFERSFHSRSPTPYDPHVHFGSEEDTAGFCEKLIPKPSKGDIHLFLKHDHLQVLRLTARLARDESKKHPIEKDRRYIINFYLSDATLAIFETVQMNSGLSGGKFLARARYKHGPTASSTFFGHLDAVRNIARWIQPADLNVGKIITIVTNTMATLPSLEILDADDFTRNFVAKEQEKLKDNDQTDGGFYTKEENKEREGKRVLQFFRSTFQHKKRKLEKAFQRLDHDRSGRINKAGFLSALSTMDSGFSEKDQVLLAALLFTPGGSESNNHCFENRRQSCIQLESCTWINYAKFMERVFS